jgi:hypothetical protein
MRLESYSAASGDAVNAGTPAQRDQTHEQQEDESLVLPVKDDAMTDGIVPHMLLRGL